MSKYLAMVNNSFEQLNSRVRDVFCFDEDPFYPPCCFCYLIEFWSSWPILHFHCILYFTVFWFWETNRSSLFFTANCHYCLSKIPGGLKETPDVVSHTKVRILPLLIKIQALMIKIVAHNHLQKLGTPQYPNCKEYSIASAYERKKKCYCLTLIC